MTHAIEYVNLIPFEVCGCDASIWSVAFRPVPMKGSPNQAVLILLVFRTLPLLHEENNFIVVSRSKDALSKSMEALVVPKVSQFPSIPSASHADFGERHTHTL